MSENTYLTENFKVWLGQQSEQRQQALRHVDPMDVQYVKVPTPIEGIYGLPKDAISGGIAITSGVGIASAVYWVLSWILYFVGMEANWITIVVTLVLTWLILGQIVRDFEKVAESNSDHFQAVSDNMHMSAAITQIQMITRQEIIDRQLKDIPNGTT